jgi:hypothetical protein
MPQKTLTGDILSQAVGKCKKLIFLDIGGCINLDNDSINNILLGGGLEQLESINLSGILSLNDATLISCMTSNKKLKILRASSCVLLTDLLLEFIIANNSYLMLLELNRTPKISDKKILEVKEARYPNLRIIRASNMIWNMKDNGYKVPLMPKDYTKPFLKGMKKPVAKKNDDKNPANQLKKLREEIKPKRTVDFKI